MTALVETIDSMRRTVEAQRRQGRSVGLVPTMGGLHAGHRALLRRARQENAAVAATLFVNPIQFDQPEDFERYPNTLESDLDVCNQEGVDWLFAPAREEMYPGEQVTFVEVYELTRGLCGKFRPGHFRGVTTVCAKLFHAVPASRAYFGEKDYQQLAVIRRMVRDLNFPLEINSVETVREPGGLALSSRNSLLEPGQREAAGVLYRAIVLAQQTFAAGERDCAKLLALVREALGSEPLVRAEYAEIVDPEALRPLAEAAPKARLMLAAWVGEVRLIDNAPLEPRGASE